jgi:hypothetical protein
MNNIRRILMHIRDAKEAAGEQLRWLELAKAKPVIDGDDYDLDLRIKDFNK